MDRLLTISRRCVCALACALAAGSARLSEAQDAGVPDEAGGTVAPAQPPDPQPAPTAGAAPAPEVGVEPATAAATTRLEPSETSETSATAGTEAPSTTVEPPGTSLFEGTDAIEASAHDAAPGDAPSEPLRVTLGGYVRSDLFVGKVPGVDQGLVKAGYGELALKLDARADEHGDAYGELRLRYGQDGPERRLHVDLREAYVDLYAGPFDLRLGQQIIVWGRADAFNPTNSFMPMDFRVRSPIEDDRRVGNLAARAFMQAGPVVRVEGVWLPLYVPTEYPRFELDPYIAIGEPDFPAPELEEGTFGGRVHLELAAFEGSVSYVHGHAPLPGFALVEYTVGEDPPEVRIARTAYRQHVVGIDGSTAVGELFAIRGEAAYRHPIDHQEKIHAARPDVQYVLGVDRAFGPVSVIAQYIGRAVLDWEREDGPEDPITPEALARFMEPLPVMLRRTITTSIEEQLAQRNQVVFSQTARVQHLASARVEWLTLHEALSLSALGLFNFTTREWLLFPKLGYKLSDAMTVYGGAEVYVGPSGTLFDLIDHELTAGYAELRYAF